MVHDQHVLHTIFQGIGEWWTIYLGWLDVFDERGLAAVVQPHHEDAHIPAEAITHGRRYLLEQPHITSCFLTAASRLHF